MRSTNLSFILPIFAVAVALPGSPAHSLILRPMFLMQSLPAPRTVVINITGKQYVPPDRTPVIPDDLLDRGARYAVRVGDTIKICNNMKFVAKPFSLSQGNSFGGRSADNPYTGPPLNPGQCMDVVVHDSGTDGTFRLFDELHSRTKITLAVLPQDSEDHGEQDTPQPPAGYDFSSEYSLTEEGDWIDGKIPALPPKRVRPRTPTDTVPGALGAKNAGKPASASSTPANPALPPNVRPCNQVEAATFAKMSGTWKAPGSAKATITGSCEAAGGEAKWKEYCGDPDNASDPNTTYTTTFTGGRMEGTSLQLNYDFEKQGIHAAEKGTTSCDIESDGTLYCQRFCGMHGKKQ
jgi:hypothetical protein